MLSEDQVQKLMSKSPGLSVQTYDQIKDITSNSQNVISRQATINIGTIGHVSHGKTTLVKAISGVDVSIQFKESKIYKLVKSTRIELTLIRLSNLWEKRSEISLSN